MTKDYGRGSDMTGAMCKERTSPARRLSGPLVRCDGWAHCRFGVRRPRCRHATPHVKFEGCHKGCKAGLALVTHVCMPVNRAAKTATGEADG